MAEPIRTIGEIVRLSTEHLAARGVDTPRLDAELLVGHALGMERLRLYTESERPLVAVELDRIRALLGRRATREPMAYILGHRAFRRLEVEVGPGVLVPRPETEMLVEWALEVADRGARVLDWGTGSGAIALALADERPDLVITAIDRSTAALQRARDNGDRLGARVVWRRSDGFDGLADERFDLVVANPPYLSDAELTDAPPELGYEPAGALSAGPTGLEAIAQIIAAAPDHLTDGGHLLLEIGHTQAEAAQTLLGGAGFDGIGCRADLAGIPRAIGGRRGP